MKKRLIGIGIGLLILLAVAFAVSAYSLGGIVKNRVEVVGYQRGPSRGQTGHAEVWLLAGRAQLNGLSIGNPPGYKGETAIKIGDVSVRLNPISAFSEKPIIDSIIVKSPEITFEGGLRNNNLAQIRKNVSGYASVPADGSQPPPAPASAQSSAARKFQLNELVITGARIHLNSLFSGGQNVTISLPDIHLVRLGAGPAGVTSPEVAEKALTALLNSIAANAAGEIPKLGEEATSTAKKLDFKKAAERLKSLFGQ